MYISIFLITKGYARFKAVYPMSSEVYFDERGLKKGMTINPP